VDHGYGVATLEEVLDTTAASSSTSTSNGRRRRGPYEGLSPTSSGSGSESDDVIVASFLDAATDEIKAYALNRHLARNLRCGEFYRPCPPARRLRSLLATPPSRFRRRSRVDGLDDSSR